MIILLNKSNFAFFVDQNNLEDAVYKTLLHHQLIRIHDHTKRVVNKAIEIAIQYHVSIEAVKRAGLLHDISGVVKNDQRVKMCNKWNIQLLEEETQLPLICHQKMSKFIAKEVYGIINPLVLEAIECHTTLKAEATSIDLVVFIADKLEWDQDGKPPYYDKMLLALENSLEKSALVYINETMTKMMVVHPWLKEAKTYLERTINETSN